MVKVLKGDPMWGGITMAPSGDGVVILDVAKEDIGKIIKDEEWHFWFEATEREMLITCWTSDELREIATKLDELNGRTIP